MAEEQWESDSIYVGKFSRRGEVVRGGKHLAKPMGAYKQK